MSGINLVSAADCAICTAARACSPTIALGAAELVENARAHLLVALIMGLRQETMPLCFTCKGKLESFAAHIKKSAS